MNSSNHFSIRIDQQTFRVEDPVITGAQILELAQKRPPNEWRLVFVRTAGSESIRSTEEVDVRKPGIEDFVTHKGDRTFLLLLNGVQHDWPAPFIEETWLRHLAQVDNSHQVWQENQGSADTALEPGQRAALGPAGVETFYTAPRSIEIIVNARPKVVTMPRLTFLQVVALADGLPSGENIVYTVVYRKGPRDNPEGSLVQGQSVKLKNGMVFNVTATDKS